MGRRSSHTPQQLKDLILEAAYDIIETQGLAGLSAREIARRIDVFARTFEPLLMAAIGIVVGTIVVLLYMPIFDLAGSLR